ncbi:predicted protein [Lichtheimia corymbifera JMRC:FSU:9682]|uniref:Uncharacterized protein n=1 Tax=Lichtheimia corymbifera JMRC:FSU:9682 TaxID=1263082 RepID=A0A068RIX6_9FUNG|nr:predicted protein [Lichtheimia corymbifera JMRC:FSU:9682]
MNWTGGQRNNNLGCREGNRVANPIKQRLQRLKQLRLDLACSKVHAAKPQATRTSRAPPYCLFDLTGNVQHFKHLSIISTHHQKRKRARVKKDDPLPRQQQQ